MGPEQSFVKQDYLNSVSMTIPDELQEETHSYISPPSKSLKEETTEYVDSMQGF